MTIFTDVTAKDAQNCERQSCGRVIHAGESCFNIDDTAGHVKTVCGGCYGHYLEKEANAKAKKTGLKGPTAQPTSQIMPPPTLNVDWMRQDINEAWRKGAHTTGGRVTALPAPTVSQNRYRSDAPPSHHSALPIGYSAAHGQHASQTDFWFQRATRGVSANQTGILTLTCFVYQPNYDAKGKHTLVPGIKESIRVQSDIGSRELSKKIRSALEEDILKLCGRHGISVNVNDMVLRDVTNNAWLKVDKYSEAKYWGDQFSKPDTRSKKPGGSIFHVPASLRRLMFGLVFDEDVWSRLEAAVDAEMFRSLQSERSTTTTHKVLAGSVIRSTRASQRPRQDSKVVKSNRAAEMRSGSDSGTRPAKRRRNAPKIISPENSEQEMSDPEIVMSDPEIVMAEAVIVDDGSQRAGDSLDEVQAPASEITKRVPPPKSAQTQRTSSSNARSGFMPLDFDTIRRAFSEGGVSAKATSGNSSADVLCETIHFIDLPRFSFQELLREPTKLRDDMLGVDAISFDAYIRYNHHPDAFIGKGAFKTTSLARLTFRGASIPLGGLGKLAQVDTAIGDRSVQVALKRFWKPTRAASKKPATAPNTRAATAPQGAAESSKVSRVGRLEAEKEKDHVFEECKLLVWANSLLTAAYEYIEAAIDDSEDKLPLQILSMAISSKPIELKGGKPSTTLRTYLLEELMPTAKVDFVKYLHNGSALTDIPRNDTDYVFAEFLMFLQHVQYMITQGTAYVSDLQGVGLLLTDPQILTSPRIGTNLFGDGNIGESFERFPEEHRCNEYCEWFELTDPYEIRDDFRATLAA